MKIIHFVFLSLSAYLFCTSVRAQSPQDLNDCHPLIQNAETTFDANVYPQCFFDDLPTAVSYWGPIATKNKWANALFEVYKRHKGYYKTQDFLHKAAELSHAQACLEMGDLMFEQGKIPEAMRYYNVASRGNLTDEEQGKITGRLAVLFANPNSSYYDIQKALPLLQKSALQRQALPNNILGTLTLFGQGGLKQDAQEAFKYFWRAVLLDCPAAQENLGFFLMAKEKKITTQELFNEILPRTYSCQSVEQNTTQYPPFRLSFTPQQCADINYYAQKLLDPSLDFYGKSECGFSADMADLADFLTQ